MGRPFRGEIPEKNSRTSGVQAGIPAGEAALSINFIKMFFRYKTAVYSKF